MTTPVPIKCAGPTGAGIEPNPCTEPGSLPRCMICPNGPGYWRNQPDPPPVPCVPLTEAPGVQWGRILTQDEGWKRTGPPAPCASCGRPAMMRSPTGVPQHRVCAEQDASD